MYVRLGFSVAVQCQPEILLIDEVLAVGDISFRNKCISRINEIKNSTSTIFISHDMSVIRHICDRIAVMYAGRIVEFGTKEKVLNSPKPLHRSFARRST